jgi:hypothetical protein
MWFIFDCRKNAERDKDFMKLQVMVSESVGTVLKGSSSLP